MMDRRKSYREGRGIDGKQRRRAKAADDPNGGGNGPNKKGEGTGIS